MLEKNKKLLIGGATGALVTGTALAIALPLTIGKKDNNTDKFVDKILNQKFKNILSAPDGNKTKAELEKIFSAPTDSKDPAQAKNAALIKVLTDYLNANKKTLVVKAYTKEVEGVNKTLLVFTNKTNKTKPSTSKSSFDASYDKIPKELKDKMAKATFALYTTQAEAKLISSEVLASPNPGALVPKEFMNGKVDYVSYKDKLITILSKLDLKKINDDLLTKGGMVKAAKITEIDFIAATDSLKSDSEPNFTTFIANEMAKDSAITFTLDGQTSLKITINYSGVKKNLIITGFKDKDATTVSPQEAVRNAKTYFDGNKDVKDGKKLPTFKADPTTLDLNAFLKTPLTVPDGVTITIAIKAKPTGEKIKQGFTVTITSMEDPNITATANLNLVGFVTDADIKANAISGTNVTMIIDGELNTKSVDKSNTNPADAIPKISGNQIVDTFKVNIKNLTPNPLAGTISYKYDILKLDNLTLTKDIKDKEGVISDFKKTTTPVDILKKIEEWMASNKTLNSGKPQVDPLAYDEGAFKTDLKKVMTAVIPSGANIIVINKNAPKNGEVTFTYKVKLNGGQLSNEGNITVTGLKDNAAIADAKVSAAQVAFNSAFGVTTGDAIDLPTTTVDGVWPKSSIVTLDALASLTGKTKPKLDADVIVKITPTKEKKLGKLVVIVEFSATGTSVTKKTTITVKGFKTQAQLDYAKLNVSEINKAILAKKPYDHSTDAKTWKDDIKTALDALKVTVGLTEFTIKVNLEAVTESGTISYTADIKNSDGTSLTSIKGMLTGFKSSKKVIEMKKSIEDQLKKLTTDGYEAKNKETINPGDVNLDDAQNLFVEIWTSLSTPWDDNGAKMEFSTSSPNEKTGSFVLKINFDVTDKFSQNLKFSVLITVKGYKTIALEKIAAKAAIDKYFGDKNVTTITTGAKVPQPKVDAWNKVKTTAKAEIDKVTTSIADVNAAKNMGISAIDAALVIYNKAIVEANEVFYVDDAMDKFKQPIKDPSKLPKDVATPTVINNANGVKIEYTTWTPKNKEGEIDYVVTFTKGTKVKTKSGKITGYKNEGTSNKEKATNEVALFNDAVYVATSQPIAKATDTAFTDGTLGITKPSTIKGTVTYSHPAITNDGDVTVVIKITINGEFATKAITVKISGIAKLKANALIAADKIIVDGIQAKNPSVAPRTPQLSVGDSFVTTTLENPSNVPAPKLPVKRVYKVEKVDGTTGITTIKVTISTVGGDNKESTFTVSGYITDAQKVADVKANAVTKAKIGKAFSDKVGAVNLAKTASKALEVLKTPLKVTVEGVEITLALVADNSNKKISWTSSAATLTDADPNILKNKNGLKGELIGFLDPVVDAANKKVEDAFAKGPLGITTEISKKLNDHSMNAASAIRSIGNPVKVTVAGLVIELELQVDPALNTSIKWTVKALEGVDASTSANKNAIMAFTGEVTGFSAPTPDPTKSTTVIDNKAKAITKDKISAALDALIENKAQSAIEAKKIIDPTGTDKIKVNVDGTEITLNINPGSFMMKIDGVTQVIAINDDGPFRLATDGKNIYHFYNQWQDAAIGDSSYKTIYNNITPKSKTQKFKINLKEVIRSKVPKTKAYTIEWLKNLLKSDPFESDEKNIIAELDSKTKDGELIEKFEFKDSNEAKYFIELIWVKKNGKWNIQSKYTFESGGKDKGENDSILTITVKAVDIATDSLQGMFKVKNVINWSVSSLPESLKDASPDVIEAFKKLKGSITTLTGTVIGENEFDNADTTAAATGIADARSLY